MGNRHFIMPAFFSDASQKQSSKVIFTTAKISTFEACNNTKKCTQIATVSVSGEAFECHRTIDHSERTVRRE